MNTLPLRSVGLAHQGWQAAHVGRLLLIVPLLWWTVRLGGGWATWCFVDNVNLAFHEAGHLIFAWAGRTVHLLGGTLGQLGVPALLAGVFVVRHRRFFAAWLCAWWVGENLINVSVYMADARTLALPLVGGGEHDWNILFYRFGLLGESSVAVVSGATAWVGALIMVAALAAAVLAALPGSVRAAIRRRLIQRFPRSEGLLARLEARGTGRAGSAPEKPVTS